MSDHGSLSGVLHHIRACEDNDLFPVICVEAYYKPNRLLKDKDHRKNWHLLLIAQNLKGWHSLIKITSEAWCSGHYHKPCIDDELLEKYSDGLIMSSACIAGYLPYLIAEGDEGRVYSYIDHFRGIFKDNFYLEIMPHDFPQQQQLNIDLSNIAEGAGIPLLATVDSHYPYPEWWDTQDILLMMATGQSLSKRKKKKDAGEDVYEFDIKTLYLMAEDEIRDNFARYHPDLPSSVVDGAMGNTSFLVNSIEPFTIDKSNKLPVVQIPKTTVEVELLVHCTKRLKELGLLKNETYTKRLENEFGVLKKNNVLDYFYIIFDMVRHARQEGIRVGPGRGSATGSLVSYLLRITAVDPISYGLLFERFINPDRKGLPDIDIDFQHDRRDEMKAYLGQRWGEDHVANIISHQTFKPKGIIQDIGRVLDISLKEIMPVTKSIDDKDDSTLEQLASLNESVSNLFKKYPEISYHAERLIGQKKHAGMHAAGVVITDKPIQDYGPVMKAKDGSDALAWSDAADFPIVSDYGFPKIDVLGIDGLTKQAHAVRLIDENIDLNDLEVVRDPYAVDEKVMEGFRKGLTLGVFQFGGRGFTNFLRRIKPTYMGDIAVANALYRPGPLEGGTAHLYGRCKNGEAEPIYWDKSIQSGLEETYGLMAYQEQVMKIVQELAGFLASQADDFRKAIGKLYRLPGDEAQKFMNQYREQWFKNNILDEKIAGEIWGKILAFGGYGFCKAHAVGYGIQAYQDMWLKINYPMQFYSALLTYDPDKADEAIREARVLDVKFLNPSVNKSGTEFTIEGNSIRFGLLSVTYIGPEGAKEIVAKQPFTSLDDFRERVAKKKVNKRAITCLIKSGAFDEFGYRDEWSLNDMAEAEKEIIGVAISHNPLVDELYQIIDERVDTEEQFDVMADGSVVICGGEVVSTRKLQTKTGKDMAFFDVAHGINNYGCTLFPNKYPYLWGIINKQEPILVRGKRDTWNGRSSIIVEEVWTAARFRESFKR